MLKAKKSGLRQVGILAQPAGKTFQRILKANLKIAVVDRSCVTWPTFETVMLDAGLPKLGWLMVLKASARVGSPLLMVLVAEQSD